MATKTYLVRFGTDNPSTYTGLSPTFTKFFNSAGNATTPPSIAEIASSGMYSFAYDPGGFIGFILDGTASLSSTLRYAAGVLDPNDKISEIGATLTALGSTLVGQGVTMSAIGVSVAAMGVSLSAQGATLLTIGNSLLVLGVSHLAQGVSISAMGVSLTAQGNTIASLGAGNALITAIGVSLTAQGNTIFGIGVSFSAFGFSFQAGQSLIGSAADSFGTSSVDPTTLFGFMKRIQELQEGDSSFAKGTGIWSIYSRGSSTLLRSKTIADAATSVTKV